MHLFSFYYGCDTLSQTWSTLWSLSVCLAQDVTLTDRSAVNVIMLMCLNPHVSKTVGGGGGVLVCATMRTNFDHSERSRSYCTS